MEGVRSGIQAGSNMRSNFTDLSDLPFSHFPPPNTNPISPLKTHNRYDDFDIKSFTMKEEQEDGSGENFGAILRKSCMAPTTASRSFRHVDRRSNVQSMVKRAFSTRMSTSIAEEYYRILDPFESLYTPPPDSYDT